MKISVVSTGSTEFKATPVVESGLRRAIGGKCPDVAVPEALEWAAPGLCHATVTEDDGTPLWSGRLDGSDEPAPDSLEARLKAAEAVCVMFGWTAHHGDTDRDKALHELWRQWSRVPGVSLSPSDHPELADAVIARLAAIRGTAQGPSGA